MRYENQPGRRILKAVPKPEQSGWLIKHVLVAFI